MDVGLIPPGFGREGISGKVRAPQNRSDPTARGMGMNDLLDLRGKTAVVTGGSRGVGLSLIHI